MDPLSNGHRKDEFDERPPSLRSMLRDHINDQKKHNKAQSEINEEVKRLSSTVYGDERAGVPGLVKDNKSNKKQLGMMKWLGITSVTSGGGLAYFWENILKIFGKG